MSNEATEQVPEWTVGDRMLKARTTAKLSQSQLADYLGMSRITLSRYETGHNRPPLTVLRLWAMRCGVPLEWLRYGDTPPLPAITAEKKSNPRKVRPPSSTKWLVISPGHASAAAA